MKSKGLVGLIAGLVLVAVGAYYSIKKKPDYNDHNKESDMLSNSIESSIEFDFGYEGTLGEPTITGEPREFELIKFTKYDVPMTNDFGEKSLEKLTIKAELDKKNNIFYFGNYTQDYNTTNFTGTGKEKLPIHARHTKLNSEWSEICIIHPKEVKIQDVKQQAYMVPPYKWENLKPLGEHEEAQKIIEGSEKILDWAMSKIPFSKKVLNKLLEHSEKNKVKYYQELLDKTNKNYIITRIPTHIPSKVYVFTESAREYKINFDVGKFEKGLSIPIYLWAKIVLGDPSQAPYGSFSNKYGELENTLIKFNLEGSKKGNYIEDLNELKTKMDPEPRTIYQSYTKIYIKYTDGSKKIIRNVGDVGYFVGFSKDGKSIIFNSSSYTRSKKGKFIMGLDGKNLREYTGPLPKKHPIQRYTEIK